ncbi:hypothetical protein [Pararhizobium antarcticum]|uniref:hypothetical protein n=1 Tax=Pararhizobium antarcticum TaxID=1798805 RepID=UPI000AF89B63|nr:hypothetical protein [Pararhizobium antarcticum]
MHYQRPFRAIVTEQGDIFIIDASGLTVTDFPRSGTLEDDLQRASAIAAIDSEDLDDA